MLAWRHVILTTRGTWLHGDPRGFRSRRHRIHSSGDYRHRPPPDEHSRLLQHQHQRTQFEVVFSAEVRPLVGRALLDRFQIEACEVIAMAVAATHTHLLARLPLDPAEARLIIGRCKGYASHAVRATLPGGIWAQGGSFQIIRDRGHQVNTYRYILERQEADAWTWGFRDARSGPEGLGL